MARPTKPKTWEHGYVFGSDPHRDLLLVAETIRQKIFRDEVSTGASANDARAVANKIGWRFCLDPYQLPGSTLRAAIDGQVDLMKQAVVWPPDGNNSLQILLARVEEHIFFLLAVDDVAITGTTGGPEKPRLIYACKERLSQGEQDGLLGLLRQTGGLHAIDPIGRARLLGGRSMTFNSYKVRRFDLKLERYFVEDHHNVVEAAWAAMRYPGSRANFEEAKRRYVRYLRGLA